jgi:hypothetical protein
MRRLHVKGCKSSISNSNTLPTYLQATALESTGIKQILVGAISGDKKQGGGIKVVGSRLAILATELARENLKKLFCADLR